MRKLLMMPVTVMAFVAALMTMLAVTMTTATAAFADSSIGGPIEGPGQGTIQPPTPTNPSVLYDCQVIVIAKDLPSGSATFNYQVTTANTGDHGGQEFPFSSGNHKVTVLSNDRWLGINWWRNGELLSAAVFARSDSNAGSEALIVYNPKDQDEQLSLDCTKH